MLPDHYLHLPSTMTLASPLIHSDERVEVMQRFRREPYLVEGELLDVPILSGNAIRGMLRRASALRICELLNVGERSLPLSAFYLLFAGGFLSGSSPTVNVEDEIRVRELCTPVALLGGSRGGRIYHGLLDVWRGEPVCDELRSWHEPHAAYDGHVPSCFDLLTEVNYTHRDDRSEDLGDEKSPVQMRYSFEALVPGTRLLHGCVLRTADELILGCLLDAIGILSRQQSIGGRAAIGHGRFRWTWGDDVADRDALIDAYHDHVRERRDEIASILGVRDDGASADAA